jgi:uncharacterized membrane protein YfhO
VASFVQDGGWKAREEAGRSLKTTLADGPFLAVSVPAGDHRIVFDYAPPGWDSGLVVSLATAAILAAAAFKRSKIRPA